MTATKTPPEGGKKTIAKRPAPRPKRAPAEKTVSEVTTAHDRSAPAPDEALPGKNYVTVDGHRFEVMPIPSRTGNGRPETFAFSKLPMSVFDKDIGGYIGPSLFIPDSEGPAKHLVAARTAAKGEKFRYHTRKDRGTAEGSDAVVEGVRVWKTVEE